MPEATPFAALGVGNGFPSCIDKVDMTQPTSSSTWSPPITNPLTLNQVMSLYWNLYGIVGTASVTGADEITQSDLNIPDTDAPKDRVCPGTYSDSRELIYTDDFNYTTQRVGVASSIIAMYDGVTTDEGNFLGYAMNSGELPFEVAFCAAFGTYLLQTGGKEVILFAGYVPATTDYDAWALLSAMYAYTGPSALTLTNVTYQGIPFIKAEVIDNSQAPVTATITDVTLYTYP